MESGSDNQCSSDSSQSGSGVDYSPTTYQCSTTKAFNDFIEKCEKPRVLEGSRSDVLEKFSQKQILSEEIDDDNAKIVVANNSSSGLEGILMRVLMKTWIPTERIRKIVDYISSREGKLRTNSRDKEGQNCGFTNILAVESASSDENNSAMENFRFRQIRQLPGETFKALYGRLRAASSKCTFSDNSRCNATDIAIRDQLLIAMNNHDLKQKALENNWDLEVLLKNGA